MVKFSKWKFRNFNWNYLFSSVFRERIQRTMTKDTTSQLHSAWSCLQRLFVRKERTKNIHESRSQHEMHFAIVHWQYTKVLHCYIPRADFATVIFVLPVGPRETPLTTCSYVGFKLTVSATTLQDLSAMFFCFRSDGPDELNGAKAFLHEILD